MNNTQLIIAAIAFVSLLLTILAGARINQRGLERQMDAFRNEMRAEIQAAAQRLETRIGGAERNLESRINSVEARLAALESRVDRIERPLGQIFKPTLPRA
jgi:uncharacterized protein Yka (UPF0111/DUF47 family)